MGGFAIIVGMAIAIAILVGSSRAPVPGLRVAAAVLALVVFLVSVVFSSVRFVGESNVGIIVKNAMGPSLQPGQIIATEGEMGPQAAILPPGWHFGYWPVIYDVASARVIQIQEGEVGLITTTDGKPMPPDQIYAPQWSEEEFQGMLIAEHFLGDGGGFKGPQASVLTPGKYRLNTLLYQIETVPVTDVEKATVGIVKSNVGTMPDMTDSDIVNRGQRGIWRQPLLPQKYYLNTKAFQVTMISTEAQVVRYTKAASSAEEREITVRSQDGFTFPVDVRVEYEIRPRDAALVVARFAGDEQRLANRLNSAVRAIFRNNAEAVKALDYVQQRSLQESQSLAMLAAEMIKVGLSITAVRIGDV
ncbi:MAG: SPFH domain-containing protein, partial [Phycisphaerales bacterium]